MKKRKQVEPVAPLKRLTTPRSLTLLSFIVAMMSPFFAGNLYLAGHWLVILTEGYSSFHLGGSMDGDWDIPSQVYLVA